MAVPQSPNGAARSRYAQSFSSAIFEPAPEARRAFVPAGKRRDQTTSEIFGSYDEKDLRSMPKTFVPKDDGLSARQKKLNMLSSEVLPGGARPQTAPMTDRSMVSPQAQDPKPPLYSFDAEEPQVDTQLLRQQQLSSSLFGRETPHVTTDQLHDRSRKLTPNDFKWHNHPERVQGGDQPLTHADRAYNEKCSTVFDHQSQRDFAEVLESKRFAREEAAKCRRGVEELKPVVSKPLQDDDAPVWHPKKRSPVEDRIVVHQDWTDSKTEILYGARSPRAEHPSMRKSDELHQARIFGQTAEYRPSERIEPVTHDNSEKLRSAIGMHPQQIHQAHLRTSITPAAFYEEAENTKHWEVVELHISGLRHTADDAYVRSLCQGTDLHIVKVRVEMDPVRNLCQGRAKIMVRYNPVRDSIEHLVQQLEAHNLRVEL